MFAILPVREGGEDASAAWRATYGQSRRALASPPYEAAHSPRSCWSTSSWVARCSTQSPHDLARSPGIPRLQLWGGFKHE